MKSLHKLLAETDSYIRNLSLVQMKLNFPLTDLAEFVNNSTSLEVLDISGNDLLPLHFAELLKVIAFNKTLHHVNFSWNKLIDRNVWAIRHEYEIQYPTMSIHDMIE